MNIVIDTPFNRCAICKDFVLKTKEENYIAEDGTIQRKMVVRCHNEGKCTKERDDPSTDWVCDDQTFCPDECDLMQCARNKKHIRIKDIPHSFFAETPPNCLRECLKNVNKYLSQENEELQS